MNPQIAHLAAVRGDATVRIQRARWASKSRALASVAAGGMSSHRKRAASRAPQRASSSARGTRSASTISAGEKAARLRCDALAPGAIRHARAEAPRPALALIGGGAGNALRLQSAHAGGRIEHGAPDQAGVDDDTHALDGQARLRDVGREDDLAYARGRGQQRGVLLLPRQLAKQRPARAPTPARSPD